MARAMKDSGVEWIGEIPAGWEVVRISSCFSEIKEKNTDSLYDNALQFKMGRIIPKPRKWDAEEIGETYSAYTIVHPGTIMVNGLNLEFDFVTQRVAIVEENGIITSAYIAMSPNDSVDADYMCYLLKAYDYRRALHNMGKGLRKILNYSELKTKPILLPPLSEQRSIVKALNAECARIDAVIEQTRTSIEEYRKLKQSLITQAVTKGIRPGRKMKDSGVEWIDVIPEEWSIERGKGLFVEVDNRSTDGSEELLTVSQYTGVTPRSQKNVNMFEAETLEGYKICEVGDIAANTMWLWAGAIGVSRYRGVISPSYNIYRQKNNDFDPTYLDFLLRAVPLVQHYESLSTGIRASRLRLYPQQFLSIRYPVPPMNEQKEIVSFLREKIDGMDSLIQKKEQYLAEIESYKKSLVFEYVTGKKEV